MARSPTLGYFRRVGKCLILLFFRSTPDICLALVADIPLQGRPIRERGRDRDLVQVLSTQMWATSQKLFVKLYLSPHEPESFRAKILQVTHHLSLIQAELGPDLR